MLIGMGPPTGRMYGEIRGDLCVWTSPFALCWYLGGQARKWACTSYLFLFLGCPTEKKQFLNKIVKRILSH